MSVFIPSTEAGAGLRVSFSCRQLLHQRGQRKDADLIEYNRDHYQQVNAARLISIRNMWLVVQLKSATIRDLNKA